MSTVTSKMKKNTANIIVCIITSVCGSFKQTINQTGLSPRARVRLQADASLSFKWRRLPSGLAKFRFLSKKIFDSGAVCRVVWLN